MHGFVRVSLQLLQELRPVELITYLSIENFHFSGKGCYASRNTLMRVAGIGCNRRFYGALRTLKTKRFIMEKQGKRYCVAGRVGVGVQKNFLFSGDYTPLEKAFNILRYYAPTATKQEIAATLKVSRRTLGRCRELPFAEVLSGSKAHQTVGQNRTPMNALKPEINKTTYTDLFGKETEAPEETNPEVVFSCKREEEERQKAEQEKTVAEETAKRSLDIFSEFPEYNKLFQELRQVFKNAPEGHIQQAVYQAIKNRKKITSTLFAYAYGILRQNLKTYGSRPESPTIPSVNNIRLEFTLRKKASEQVKLVQQEQATETARQDVIVQENQAFIESLTGEEREQVETALVTIGNPKKLPFIPATFARTAALAMEDMRDKLLQTGCCGSEGGYEYTAVSERVQKLENHWDDSKEIAGEPGKQGDSRMAANTGGHVLVRLG